MTLAGYRIESVIGRGGMGVVYLAEHLRLKRKVALKVLVPELAEDERFRARFVHESELAASLEHPNVVPIYDAGESGRDLYIAMRYVAGTDLRSLIKAESPLEPARALSVVAQVASALDAAHERGLIHRDVKSANVLIEAGKGSLGEHAYLTDFGLTKRPESVSGLTKTGQFLGSVEYAAPEQFEGKPLTPQTDVYSLGCVLYECLTGDVPFPREHEAAVMHAHLRESPPRPTDKRPDLPHGIDAVEARAMAKRPADRYPTCGALAESVRGTLPQAGPPPGVERAGARRRWAQIGAGMAVLLVGGVLAAVLLTRGGEPSTKSNRPPTAPALPGQGVVRIDARTGTLVTVLPVPGARAVAVDDRFAWVQGNDELTKVSVASNIIVASISPVFPVQALFGFRFETDVAAAGGSVWVTDNRSHSDARTFLGRTAGIDPNRNRRSWVANVPHATAVIFAAESLWVTDPGDGLLYRLDPSDGTVIDSVEAESSSTPYPLAWNSSGIWVAGASNGVALIDPDSNEVVKTIPMQYAASVAADDDWLWVSNGPGGVVTQYTADGGSFVRIIRVGSNADALTVDANSVWVADNKGRTVSKVDRRSGTIQKRIKLSGTPYDLAVAGDAVWLTLFARPSE
jgi:tRNA A-37 threonylcarbamoyl transferase component Bud32